MRRVILLLIIMIACFSRANAMAPDTVDHWQIYNGTQQIIACHENSNIHSCEGAIKINSLSNLRIRYFHCTTYIDVEIQVKLVGETGKTLAVKKFVINSGDEMVFNKEELNGVKYQKVAIHYKEIRSNGIDKVIGKIIFK
jgi:hypothetical protein